MNRRVLYGRLGGQAKLNAYIRSLGPAGWWLKGQGQTVTGSGVSQWDDISGNGRHLLQGTDAARPALQADGSVLFNGSSHYLRASFTSNQPITDYLVCRPLSWTASDQLIGGVSANAGAIEQSGSTPAVVLYDGSAVASNTNLALNARAVVCAVHNGANGVLRVNNTTETTGNSGSGNPGGITLFANNTPSGFANAIGYELVRFHAAHDLATRARIVAGLMARHGVA